VTFWRAKYNSLLKGDFRDKCEKNVHLDPEYLFSEVLKVVECRLGSYAVHQHEALNNNKKVKNRFLAPLPPPPHASCIGKHILLHREKKDYERG
jgi:hypothetical protein